MRIALRATVGLLLLLYAVSHFWTGWLERLPPEGQAVAYGLLLVMVVVDVAMQASPRFSEWVLGLFTPRT